MISTIIVDAQKEERTKIGNILSAQGDIKIVALGQDGVDALRLISGFSPDLLILDSQAEFVLEKDVLSLLKNRSPSIEMIVIADSCLKNHELYKVIANEISGIVHKNDDLNRLPDIVRCVSHGGCYISPLFTAKIRQLILALYRSDMDFQHLVIKAPYAGMAGKPLEKAKLPPEKDPVGFLSKTELKILMAIGEGYTNNEIAENLCLVRGTVNNYVSRILHKTALQERSQIASYAVQYKLILEKYKQLQNRLVI